jgi:hypothetical protein
MVFLTATAIVVAFGLLTHFLPGLMRPELYFAVRVNPEFRHTETGRRILLRYRLIMWAGVGIAVALEFALGPARADRCAPPDAPVCGPAGDCF